LSIPVKYVSPGSSINEIIESPEEDGAFPPHHHDQGNFAFQTISDQISVVRHPEMKRMHRDEHLGLALGSDFRPRLADKIRYKKSFSL
jgi:hypothetical protein